jgi:hypothetical protein
MMKAKDKIGFVLGRRSAPICRILGSRLAELGSFFTGPCKEAGAYVVARSARKKLALFLPGRIVRAFAPVKSWRGNDEDYERS